MFRLQVEANYVSFRSHKVLLWIHLLIEGDGWEITAGGSTMSTTRIPWRVGRKKLDRTLLLLSFSLLWGSEGFDTDHIKKTKLVFISVWYSLSIKTSLVNAELIPLSNVVWRSRLGTSPLHAGVNGRLFLQLRIRPRVVVFKNWLFLWDLKQSPIPLFVIIFDLGEWKEIVDKIWMENECMRMNDGYILLSK